MNRAVAVVVLHESAMATARRIREHLPDARIHGRGDGADVVFESLGDHVRALFRAGAPIVGLCAAGVLIRVLAPALGDKRREPPVVAVADDGSAVVPLLGGHHGGNALARDMAAIFGVSAAITTAGDARFGVALDEPPAGWRLANPDDAKPFVAALLGGATVTLEGAAPWLTDSRLPFAATGEVEIVVTDAAVAGSATRLVFHPGRLALGVGCARGVAAAELADLVHGALNEAGLAPEAIAGVFSIDVKADEAAIHDLAAALDAPARFFDAATLEAETPRLANPSETVFREVGSHGVAEAAALAAGGPDAELVVAKRKSAMATCAVARAPGIIGADVGRPRGTLSVVGIGPGGAAWRTPEAEAAIAASGDLVGYRLYLDLLGGLAHGKTRHDYGLGEEQARVRAALDLAAAGRRVALVCSGDAGIYALASLVYEERDHAQRADWRRVEVRVVPGISAMQAAAARAGAPLGHDFCAISLSDLMTPWDAIERRLRAAADGDFVVALYNPASRRRQDQLIRARDILLTARPADTPVVLARNLGRDGECIRTIALAELTADMADMLTLVLVGASTTRVAADGAVYTPRGYAEKAAQ